MNLSLTLILATMYSVITMPNCDRQLPESRNRILILTLEQQW